MGLIEKIRDAGVVGCGGAGFPTHVKLNARAEHFLVNGAECEPLLRTDHWLMENCADALVKGAMLAAKQVQASTVTIALKKTYTPQITALREAVEKVGREVDLFLLDNFYPAGDEHMVVREVLGKSIPPGGLPGDAGAVVCNVATVLAIEEASRDIPVTHRVLTVAGWVAKPVVVCAPLGTPLLLCIQAAGGALDSDYRLLVGGPAMGKLLEKGSESQAVVTKTTSGMIVLPSGHHLAVCRETNLQHTISRARSSCIQCSFCTQLCPRWLSGHPLEPHRIMRTLAYGDGSLENLLESEAARQAMLCCECGVCEDYACPMGLKPRQINSLLKRAFAAKGNRYERSCPVHARPEREERKIPPKRLAARLGVLSRYDATVADCIRLEPESVSIPMQQHIGTTARPMVSAGDLVQMGQRIGTCPDGSLGAHVHASIAGRVVRVEAGRVMIDREGGGT